MVQDQVAYCWRVSSVSEAHFSLRLYVLTDGWRFPLCGLCLATKLRRFSRLSFNSGVGMYSFYLYTYMTEVVDL